MDEDRAKIIRENPIGNGLDVFRTLFRSTCESSPVEIDQLSQEDLKNLSISLVTALLTFKAPRLLPPRDRAKTLSGELSRLHTSIDSDDFDFDRVIPLLKVAVNDSSDDTLIWLRVYDAVTEPTPPPRPLASSVLQTPLRHNTSGLVNSSEYRQDMDRALKEELGPLYVGIPEFHERFFGGVTGLETASKAALKKCMEGDNPLLDNDGWTRWPKNANQDGVLSWFTDVVENLATFTENYQSTATIRRRPLAQPNKPIQGSTGERKIDVAFVNDPDAGENSLYHWKHILVPGELKRNPAADVTSGAWLDLARYAREVLAAQDDRRYVLGFTLCGSLMRIWEFDRLGGIASDKFNIHENALQFVSTIIGFLWMSDEELGFDPTIISLNGQRYIEITRNGQTERLIINEVIRRAPCIVGRATTCWKAFREGHPEQPLVIKDSWQYTERGQEGELLREIMDKGVVNVARYYYHETVRVSGKDDDVLGNVRKGLDIMTAENYRIGCSLSPSTSAVDTLQKGHSSAGVKRPSSQIGAPLPPRKRQSIKTNRIRRRLVLNDYGKPIYEASSRIALLRAFEGCIRGHQSLHSEAEILHRDISINNLMINEDTSNNPSWPAFLIDLDFSIKESRTQASSAEGRTGTRAFMAIGALWGEQHSFMHDLESFFWVLFWICIHYDGPGQGRVVPRFDKWNYADMEDLATLKLGMVSNADMFRATVKQYFTEYYKPLISCVIQLRQAVFPSGRLSKAKGEHLYTSMIKTLHLAQQDKSII